jgi:O-acetyl-ADP-ribose deacetylase (regulator of RNase III)
MDKEKVEKISMRSFASVNEYFINFKFGLKLILKRDDLTVQETNVIVNAANDELWLGGGVAGAIRRKGGEKIQDECRRIVKERGKCFDNGAVVPTEIGDFDNKNLKKIFHAVGPIYRDGERGEEEELRKTFFNCFILAEELKLESISLPPISSGIFGYPKKECANVYYETLIKFIKDKIEKNSSFVLKEIRMVIIDYETYLPFVKSLNMDYSNKFKKEFENEITDTNLYFPKQESINKIEIENSQDLNKEENNNKTKIENSQQYEKDYKEDNQDVVVATALTQPATQIDETKPEIIDINKI